MDVCVCACFCALVMKNRGIELGKEFHKLDETDSHTIIFKHTHTHTHTHTLCSNAGLRNQVVNSGEGPYNGIRFQASVQIHFRPSSTQFKIPSSSFMCFAYTFGEKSALFLGRYVQNNRKSYLLGGDKS